MIKKVLVITILSCLMSSIFANSNVGIPNDYLDLIKNYELGDWGFNTGKIHLQSYGVFRNWSSYSRREFRNFLNINNKTYKESKKRDISFEVILRNRYTDIKSDNDKEIDKDREHIIFPEVRFRQKNYFSEKHFYEITSDTYCVYGKYSHKNSDEDHFVQENFLKSKSFLGVGFGRIRNVSPIITAIRINERLKFITESSHLDDNEIESLSRTLSQKSKYANVFSRPDKNYWDNINKSVNGKMDKLSTFEYEYIKEAFLENIGIRKEGYTISIGSAFWGLHKHTSGDSTYFDSIQNEDIIYIGPSISSTYYKNITTQFQIGFKIDLEYFKDLKNEIEQSDILITLFNDYLLNITDRLNWYSSINFQYQHNLLKGIDWSNEGSCSFVRVNSLLSYMLIDNIDFGINFSLHNFNSSNSFENPLHDMGYSNLKHIDNFFSKISLGITYYFGNKYF